MAQRENLNAAIDRFIEDLERDVERVRIFYYKISLMFSILHFRQRICNNQYRAQGPRERDAHLLALLLTTLAITCAMAVANVKEQLARLNLDNPGPGGDAN